jgi:hypothetical protein
LEALEALVRPGEAGVALAARTAAAKKAGANAGKDFVDMADLVQQISPARHSAPQANTPACLAAVEGGAGATAIADLLRGRTATTGIAVAPGQAIRSTAGANGVVSSKRMKTALTRVGRFVVLDSQVTPAHAAAVKAATRRSRGAGCKTGTVCLFDLASDPVRAYSVAPWLYRMEHPDSETRVYRPRLAYIALRTHTRSVRTTFHRTPTHKTFTSHAVP